MVLAYHVIFCAYGFWLPNDPRGSWSDWIGSYELLRHGKPTGRRPPPFEPLPAQLRRQPRARQSLKMPPVVFNDGQVRALGRGFGRVVVKCGYVVWACSIMPNHVHMVIRRHHYKVEQIVRLLKQGATQELATHGLHPLGRHRQPDGSLPTVWERSCWRSFLDTPEGIECAIAYVEANPDKQGRPRQHWPFVRPVEL